MFLWNLIEPEDYCCAKSLTTFAFASSMACFGRHLSGEALREGDCQVFPDLTALRDQRSVLQVAMRKCFFGRGGPFGIVFASEHFGIKDRLASGIDAVLFDNLLCLGFLAGHELERGPGSLAVLPGAWHEPRSDIAYRILIARTFHAGISHDVTNLRFRRIGESRIVFGRRDDHGNFSLLHGEVELVPAVIRYSLGDHTLSTYRSKPQRL